jgi:hypothetical protein
MNKQVWGMLSFGVGCICGMLSGKNFSAGNIGAGLAWSLGADAVFLIVCVIYQQIELGRGK